MSAKFVLSTRDVIVVTVGDEGSDIKGFDNRAVQIALDTVNNYGGGTVSLSEGTFEIMAPIRLYSNIQLKGSGEGTILHKVDGFRTPFIADADYGELMVKVKDPSGLKEGMGLMITDSQYCSAWNVSTAASTKIEGDIIHFDNYLVRDYSFRDGGRVSNACSIIEGVNVNNCSISNLVIDGNCKSNDPIDGCRGGGIYLHKAYKCLVENVTVKNFSGDGISWQITNDIIVRDCTVIECTNYGLHPGTGSGSSIVENNTVHHNGADGIFVCWRVQNGVFKNNNIYQNRRNGISIGHKDTGNCFEGNSIVENGYCGVYTRNEIESNGAHNNTYSGNIIRDNGGFGILFDGEVKGNVIKDNSITDSGSGIQKVGICLKGTLKDYSISNNNISAPIENISVS